MGLIDSVHSKKNVGKRTEEKKGKKRRTRVRIGVY